MTAGAGVSYPSRRGLTATLVASVTLVFLIAVGVAGVAVGLHQRLRLAPSVRSAAPPGPGLNRRRRP